MNTDELSSRLSSASKMLYMQMHLAESLYMDEILKSGQETQSRYYAFELGVAEFIATSFLSIEVSHEINSEFFEFLNYYGQIKYGKDVNQVLKFWHITIFNGLKLYERQCGINSFKNQGNPGHSPSAYLADALRIEH